jgi:DNA helicase MCM8
MHTCHHRPDNSPRTACCCTYQNSDSNDQQHAEPLITCFQARQLDSLVRLTVARARADLREEATAHDAQDVIELMKFAMRDFFRDSVPFIRVADKSRSGAKADCRRLMETLRSMKRTQGKDRVTIGELASIADDLELHSMPLQEMIESLNEAGELLKKGAQTFSF